MKKINDTTIALLIDGDNAAPKRLAAILEEVSKTGTITIRRIYGDCDDAATLVAALLLALGISVRFTAVRHEARSFFEHVFAEGLIDESWTMLDPHNAAMPAGNWQRMTVNV